MVSKGSQEKLILSCTKGFQGSVSLLRALSFLYTRTVLAPSTVADCMPCGHEIVGSNPVSELGFSLFPNVMSLRRINITNFPENWSHVVILVIKTFY